MPSSLNGTGVTFNDGSTLQSGNIPAANLGSGTANSNTFLRGDRTFATLPAPVIADGSVTTAKIANANVTRTKLNIQNRSFSGNVPGNNGSVTIVSNDVAAFWPRLTTSQNNNVRMGGEGTPGTGARLRIGNVISFDQSRAFAVTWSFVA